MSKNNYNKEDIIKILNKVGITNPNLYQTSIFGPGSSSPKRSLILDKLNVLNSSSADLGNGTRFKMYFLPKSEIHRQKLEKIHQKYVKYYGEHEKLLDMYLKEAKVVYLGPNNLGEIHHNNLPRNLQRLLQERQKGLKEYCQEDDLIQQMSNIEQEYPLNATSPGEVSQQITKYCNHIVWNKDNLPKNKKNNCHLPNHKILPKLVQEDYPQYVFGFRDDIAEYTKCPKYFQATMMKAPEFGKKPCHYLVEWTPTLNLTYNLCAAFSSNKFVRFILPRGHHTPYKRQIPVEHSKIYRGQPIAIMTIDFIDDRDSTSQHPTSSLVYIIFHDPVGKKEYWDWLHMEMDEYPIYNLLRDRILQGLLFKARNVSFQEFNWFISPEYIGLHPYQPIGYRQMVLFAKEKLNKDQMTENKLRSLYYIIVRSTKNYKRAILLVEDNNPSIRQYYRGNGVKIEQMDNHLVIIPPDIKLDQSMKDNAIKQIRQLFSGGGSRPPKNNFIKLERTSSPLIYNDSIATTYYDQYFNLTEEYFDLFNRDYTKAIQFSMKLYPYNLILPSDILFQTTYQYRKTQDRTLSIKKLLGQTIPKTSIIKYRPETSRFFHCWELLQQFDLLKNNSGQKILELSNLPSIHEAVVHYVENYHDHVPSLDLIYFTKYDYSKHQKPEIYRSMLKRYQEMIIEDYNLQIALYKDYLKPQFIKNTGNKKNKYDLIYSNLYHFADWENSYFIEHVNWQLLMGLLLFALCRLKKGGALVLVVEKITTKPMADLILIAKQFFQKTNLYYNEIHNKFKMTGNNVILQNYLGMAGNRQLTKIWKDLFQIFEKLYKYDPSNIGFNIVDNDMRIQYEVTKEIVPARSEGYELASLVGIEAEAKDYDFIRDYNKKLYFEKFIHLQKLINLKQGSTKLLEGVKDNRVLSSLLWANKFDLETFPFDKRPFSSQFGQLILQHMFAYHQELTFVFKKPLNLNKRTLEYIPVLPAFDEMKRRLWLTDRIIDTRNIEEWYTRKLKVRYYRPGDKSLSLGKLLTQKFNIRGISQAWIKMYEIITKYPIFDKTSGVLRSFHLCEAPGNFMAAINHYLKTKVRRDIDFDWFAQSLNPFDKRGVRKSTDIKTAFGDNYGLMRRFPNRWDWEGKDGTGDLTVVDNIKYYRNYVRQMGVTLITSDCGVPFTGRKNENVLLKLHYAQLMFMLVCSNLGGNFVSKVHMPIHKPIYLSLLYIMWRAFDKLIFHKTVINSYSREFYIVGLGFRGIDADLEDKLFAVLEQSKFDPNYDMFNDEYPEEFQQQLVNGLRQLVDRYVFTIERQLYYVDHYDLIDPAHFQKIEKYITQKNIDWIKRYKIERIKSDDQL